MAILKTDSPLSRRIAVSFLRFLDSVEPSVGVDCEAVEVARECLAEVFKIDSSTLENQPNCDSLVDIFSSREANERCENGNSEVANAPSISSARNSVQNTTSEHHFHVEDALFGQFLDSLEKNQYFKRMPDGNDDQVQLDRATNIFHNAVEEIKLSGDQSSDQKNLAENFKSQGNRAMQSKLYNEAIELYTFSIALCEDNAVYYCNRAAAFTQINRYAEAVHDCLKSIHINPNYSKAYSRLGFAYYAQGKYEDAIDKGFMRALELDPTNDSVKENIRVAKQKLKEQQQRYRQNSTSTSHGESSQQSENGSRSHSVPLQFPPMSFNMDSLPGNISSMFRNMAATVNGEQMFESRPEGESFSNTQNEPEIRIGGNINLNVNELPEELSGAFRSMMGMFTEPSSQGTQRNDANGRSSSS